MSSSPSPSLESRQLATVRVRRMRAARGACWVIVIGLLSAASVALLDAAVRLPPWMRGLALAAWVTSIGVLAWRFVVRSLRDDPIPQPNREARRELPDNLRAAAAATLALAGCLFVATVVPGSVEQLRRVALPWQRAAVSPYRIVVTSGDPVVRRGSTVTLSAYTEKTDASAPGAGAATLIWRAAGDPTEQRLPMTGDGNGGFHVTRPVPSDFQYRVEIGNAVSDWFTVVAIDAVELAEGTVTEIMPPKYAAMLSKSVRPGFAALDGLQHSTAEFRFRFTRAPVEAYLEFRAEGITPELTRIALSSDRLSGTATFRLKQDGKLRFVTVVEQEGRKLRTEEPTVTVQVTPDAPPQFERISGVSPRAMMARPGERLRIVLHASDDLAVDSAVFDWVLGDADTNVTSVPIPLTGAGTPKAHGELEFDLTNKAKLGDTLRFRLRVLDSRRLDDPSLKPQEAVYPESGWASVRVVSEASPGEVQEILGRWDVVREKLEAARKQLRDEAQPLIAQVRPDAGKAAFPPDHVTRLGNSREYIGKATESLRAAARESSLCLESRGLSASIQAVADGLLREADDAFRRAAFASPADRVAILAAGQKQLAEAITRTESLLTRNEQQARRRLDLRALAGLTAAQAALVQRAASTPAAELFTRQKELLDGFNKLLQESTPLRTASEAAKQRQFATLAEQATELAERTRELDEAIKTFHAEARARLFASINAEQKELANDTAALLERIETAARLANAALPKAEEFRQVVAQVADGRNVEALVTLAQLTQTLDGLAGTFEKLASERGDAKVAARHLAQWQDDLRTRFRAATGGNAANFAGLPAATQQSFRTEQAAIHAATKALRVPPGDGTAARDTAVADITIASNFLAGTGMNADRSMEVAVRNLKSLGEKLPTIPERLAKTRPEFDKVVREQESILVGTEQVLRKSDPAAYPMKFGLLIARQKRQLTAFAALDLPGFDTRRMHTLTALAAAIADLEAALPQDVPASQAWVKRELERWRNLLFDNMPPPDEKADELARRMDEIAKTLQTSPPSPTLATNVQDIFRQLGKLPKSPDAASLLNEALGSTQAADFAFRNNPKQPELQRKVRTAADDLNRLADRLNGVESDHERVRRLATNRRTAAIRAKEILPNSPVNPEAARELGRELEELSLTRVGVVGQTLKKRALDEYARLRDKPAPDRQAGAHANLATMLEELAALMADVEELTASFSRNAPPSTESEADLYLPSKLFADSLRELGRRYRNARERIANLPEEQRKWTKPAATDPLARIETEQRQLAADVAKFAEEVFAAGVKTQIDPSLAESEARFMADRLRSGSVRGAQDHGERAARFLRKIALTPEAQAASRFADRQDAIVRELAKAATGPAMAARQRARTEELAVAAGAFAKALGTAARDVGADATAWKSLTDAAEAVTAGAKALRDADARLQAGQVEDAASLREDAETRFRDAATKAAAAGPPSAKIDADVAVLGESLRRVELAMRQVLRELGEKQDAVSLTQQMQIAAEGLSKAAKVVRARHDNQGK